jgi:hypothetical protein
MNHKENEKYREGRKYRHRQQGDHISFLTETNRGTRMGRYADTQQGDLIHLRLYFQNKETGIKLQLLSLPL